MEHILDALIGWCTDKIREEGGKEREEEKTDKKRKYASERKRERETDRQTDRQTEIGRASCRERV